MKNPFPGIISEIRKVIWPTPKEMVGLFALVVGLSAIAAMIILGLDFFFAEVREVLLGL